MKNLAEAIGVLIIILFISMSGVWFFKHFYRTPVEDVSSKAAAVCYHYAQGYDDEVFCESLGFPPPNHD